MIAVAAPVDDVLNALADRRRRLVLYYLRDEGTAGIDEVADHVAAAEEDVPVDGVTDEQRARVKTSLVHAHLPQLVDAGLVEYDRRTGVIRYAHPPTLLEKLLGVLGEIETTP